MEEKSGVNIPAGEAARVAAAFGVKKYRRINHPTVVLFEGKTGKVPVWWHIQEGGWSCITLGDNRRSTRCQIARHMKAWHFFSAMLYKEEMARGLYCLGFEDERVLSQLPSLSMHEKLELRLSMPREFWPHQWVEEVS